MKLSIQHTKIYIGCSQSGFMREVHSDTGQTEKLRKIPNNNLILHPK